MSMSHAAERIAAAIQEHLIGVDATPPTLEATRLANEVTEIVRTELNELGSTRETLEGFFVATTAGPWPRARHELRVRKPV